jgi:hypothetical protein
VSRLVVNVTWTDLVSLALIRQSRNENAYNIVKVVFSMWSAQKANSFFDFDCWIHSLSCAVGHGDCLLSA